MKLNFKREKVVELNDSAVEFLRGTVGKGDAAKERKNFSSDWLTLYAEVEAQTELIEQLEKALKHAVSVIDHSFTWNDEMIESAISAVDMWMTGREQK